MNKPFSMQLTGDSMAPDFVTGGIVAFDPALTARPGDFCLAQFLGNQGAKFSQLTEGDGALWLTPLNKAHPPIKVTESVRIVARAVQYNPPGIEL